MAYEKFVIYIYLAWWKIAISNPKFCQILPQKNRKICHILPQKLPILRIKFTRTNRRTHFFFVPGGPEYYIDLKMHTKSHLSAYQKEE